MFTLGPIGFTAPWLLLALIALPILWILLRAVPPAPIRRRFPGVALLLGLTDDETQTDKTPWWLLLIRTLAVALIILGFAGPVLNPRAEAVGTGPLLILVDGTWADARDWQARVDRIDAALAEAARSGRPAAVVRLTDLPPGDLPFQAADTWRARLASLQPDPWVPDQQALQNWAANLPDTGFQTFWLSDGLARDSRDPLLQALEARGPVTVFENARAVQALRPARFEDGDIALTALRSRAGDATAVTVLGRGLDPAGVERELARVDLGFEANGTEASTLLSLPPELRNRVSRFEIAGVRSAGAVSLTDDALKRREVALIAGRDDREGLELLSPLHYLKQALEPTADLIEGDLADILLAAPDVLILADVATLAEGEQEPLLDWIEKGGLLLRFAGTRLAASDISRAEEDALMPVRLRAGGRTIGGAMSWGEPKALRPFAEGSPFYGLAIPQDVVVSSQVMAQPDPQLGGSGDRKPRRRHAAGDAQADRAGAGRAVPRHRQCRVVDAAAVGSVRADAGAAGGVDASVAAFGRGSRPGRPGCPKRFWTPSARCATRATCRGCRANCWPTAAPSADDAAGALRRRGPADRGERDRTRDRAGADRLARAHRRRRASRWCRKPRSRAGCWRRRLALLCVDILASLWLGGTAAGRPVRGGRHSRSDVSGGAAGRGAGRRCAGDPGARPRSFWRM